MTTNHLDAHDLVFVNDLENGIHSGGFSINSMLMREGFSPIKTLNTTFKGGSKQVSDLFDNIVVPNWALSYDYPFKGGNAKPTYDDDDDDEDDVLDESIHEKLVNMVQHHSKKSTAKKRKKLSNKKTKKNI
jgi:hypothetical protein